VGKTPRKRKAKAALSPAPAPGQERVERVERVKRVKGVKRKAKAKAKGARKAKADSADLLWEHVLKHWSEDAAHAAFIEHCRSRQQLGCAAQRYREHLEAGKDTLDPTTHVQVAERLADIRALAVAEFKATLPDDERSFRRARFVLVLLALALLLAALIVLARGCAGGMDAGLPPWSASA